ncbi:MAG: NUDIX hydrolase [bacterium]|nr:NUDIX hydrolase [bacterium]
MKNYRKIPNNAQLVFKGILHDTYQWQQKMFDGNIATFEALRRKPSVITIATTIDFQIIIIEESQPNNQDRITLSGGIVDDEDLLNNAKRELLEETGYTSEEWSFWKKIDILEYSKLEWESNFFIAKNCNKVAEQKLDNGEKIEVKLLSFNEFISLVQTNKFSNSFLRNYILEARNKPKMIREFYELIF